jgi:hypothetical protein
MVTGQLESLELEKVQVLGLYFYVLRTREARNIQCYAEISNCQGYDILCREGVIGQTNKLSGLIKIPHGSCDILVLRPTGRKCSFGSLFSEGVLYNEINILTSKEQRIIEFLQRK